jgi:tRNA pseudouridine13 synthase
MKLKQDPDDFQVEELTSVRPGPAGPFAIYRLDKRGWTTPDAASQIRRRWQLNLGRVSWGGLKDRHAATIQYISIFHGPRRNFERGNIRLTYLGQILEPYTSRAVDGNHFRIRLRDLSQQEVETARAGADSVRQDGAPNYFDDQRFGSVSAGRDFIAARMIRGEWEEALRLALAEPNPSDRSAVKREKAILWQHWNDWPVCRTLLPRGHARSLVDYLVHHPDDYRGAVARMRPELQGLYLSAYQSYLWNAILAEWLGESIPESERVALHLRLGPVPAPRRLDEGQREHWLSARLPLPAARWPFEANAPWAAAAHRVLDREGLTWAQLKIRGLRKPYFARGERAAWCIPDALTVETAADERHAGRWSLRLEFRLPRGSYATLVVKRLMAN